MAFTYAKTDEFVTGNRRVVYGTFDNGTSDTGGTISTGLSRIDFVFTNYLQETGTNVGSVITVNKILGGDVKIQTKAWKDGLWRAEGI